MTLTIEDGTGVPGADCYADVAACSAYAVLMWGSALTGNTADKEAAIRRAAVFMNALPWGGSKTHGRDQALAWPRSYAVDGEGNAIATGEIPVEVIEAQHIFARAEFKKPGALAPNVTLSGQKVLTGLKGITWQVIAAPNTPDAARETVTMALDKIKGLMANAGSTKFLARA